MGLREEFADAVDAIRDFQFHATRVSLSGNIYRIIPSLVDVCLWSYVSFFVLFFFTPCGEMRSRTHVLFLNEQVWVQLTTIPLRKGGQLPFKKNLFIIPFR